MQGAFFIAHGTYQDLLELKTTSFPLQPLTLHPPPLLSISLHPVLCTPPTNKTPDNRTTPPEEEAPPNYRITRVYSREGGEN